MSRQAKMYKGTYNSLLIGVAFTAAAGACEREDRRLNTPPPPPPSQFVSDVRLQPGPTQHVDLPRSIPVVLFYATAIADGEGGARFAADIYGRDVKLEQALAARRSPMLVSVPTSAPRHPR